MKKTICCLMALLLLFSNVLASAIDFKNIFRGKDACFLLYDLKANKIVIEYNNYRHCQKRVFACSTFKIPIALMAFDQNILQDENTIIKWDGVKREFDQWNRDQTPKSWLNYSSIWVSQQLTPQIGMGKIKRYLRIFHYGNQDMSGGITKAWLSSSLQISPYEQLIFLKNFWQENLPISIRAIRLTKKSIHQETLSGGNIISGKTGSGMDDLKGYRVGWFVGHLTHGSSEYIFVTNFTDLKRPSSLSAGEEAKNITKKLLLKPMKLY